MLSQSSASFVLSSPSPLAPLFQPDLGLTKAEVGFLSSATSAGAWAVVLVAGLLTDRYGTRKVMSIGLILTGGLMLSMSLVDSLVQAVGIMFVAGLARGAIPPSSTKAVLQWFPPSSRATAMGIKQMGLPVSGVLAASILPTLGLALGWRRAMAIPGLFIAAAGVLAAAFMREAPGIESVSARAIETRQAMVDLMRNRMMLILCCMAILFHMVQLSMITYLALYFKDVVLVSSVPDQAMRIVAAGGFLAVCQVGGAMGRPGWGIVSDRLFGGRRMAVLAVIGTLSGLTSILMAIVDSAWPLSLLTVAAFVFGTAALGWNGVYNALLTETVNPKYAATGVGLSMTVTELGTIIGPPLFGMVADVTGFYQPAWIFLGCVSAAGAAVALFATRWERRV